MPRNIDSQQAELYRHTHVHNDYELVSGLFVLPVAEDPPSEPGEQANWSPVVAVRAFADYRMRRVNYSATKEYSPPHIPTPETTGPFTFVGGGVSIPFPIVNTAGGFTWMVEADYYFVETCYSDPNSGYVLGQLPYVYPIQAEYAKNLDPSGNDAPPTVQQSGVGPKLGYALAQTLDLDDPLYLYSEGSYYPGRFNSDDLVAGPSSYVI